jgi:hypothetical protein
VKKQKIVHKYSLTDDELYKLGLEITQTKIDENGQEWVLLGKLPQPRRWWQVWRKK